jgi:tRNA(Ile)-lysidine synthase
LLRAVTAAKQGGAGRVHAAHFNHHLREGADADERFVRDLCRKMAIECVVGHAEAGSIWAATGDGIEANARRLRYEFFERTAARLGARFVATAHTADDQTETILQRILRGTGLNGLAGIARARKLGCATVIRPFLGFARAEIERYLADLGQEYRQDESNADPRFTRNRIRHELLPLLRRDYNTQADEAILRLGILAGEAQSVVEEAVATLFARNVKLVSEQSVVVETEGLEKISAFLLRELGMAIWKHREWPLRAMGFAEWTSFEAMLRRSLFLRAKEFERQFFPGGIEVETVRGEMRLQRAR